MNWKVRGACAVLILFALYSFVVPAGGVAHAATLSPKTPLPGPSGYYYAVNCCTSNLYTTVDSIHILGPASGHIDSTYSFSASWSANVGISYQAVQATVGFSLSYTWSINPGCSLQPPNGRWAWLDFQEVYFVQYFDVYWHSYYTGKNTYAGGGSAQTHNFWQCIWYYG